MAPLSGTQTALSASGYTADIASVGATLRTLRFDGRDLVAPFEADEVRPDYFGAILVPWPNRVTDGRYRFDGVDYELSLTEPERGQALHGLAAWLDFAVVESSDSHVLLRARIPAQVGYPFPLEVDVRYALDAAGLSTTVTTTNLGERRAPYGVAPHPYLVAGEGTVDEWTLELHASRVLEVDERLTPGDVVDVDDHFDFRAPRQIGAREIDNAYTGIDWDADGTTTLRLTVDGHGTAMTWSRDLGWLQIFTGDLPTPARRRRAVAVEPMTCPPDAFNSGTDLVILDPGASHSATWTIAAI
ncbi:aldose 1-epimerase family protein [Herbiconiux sp. L3-i23]|uniref:aldose 1-epimerase family protein n=1 Tax=Herbiconiux sp. L3-i23 TaxID=2905871 RepID=UPI00204F2397|nr:aldose 1-epimerase family protein [Herbiconiux sp. L3-i23]BDI23665.1 galactose mutarotase [Herbiconiux sp. L3-i23]